MSREGVREIFSQRRGGRIVITAVVTALAFAAAVSAKAGEMLCRRAGASLPIGAASPTTLLDNVRDVVEAQEDVVDVSATLQTWHAGPDLLHAVEDLPGYGQYTPRVKWLAHGALGAVEMIAGTADCQTLIFFRVLDGRAVKIATPKGLNTEQACWGDNVWLGTVGGTPYAVEQTLAPGDRSRSIFASRWTGTDWDPPCSLTERNSVTLVVDNEFCRPGTDCTTLQAEALERAKNAQAEYERATSPQGSVSATSGDDRLATSHPDLPGVIPTFGQANSNPYTAFTAQQVFETSYRGQPVVGTIGPGHFGWRDYDGWLVAFWRSGKDGYEPLAGLQISRQLGVVSSLAVHDP